MNLLDLQKRLKHEQEHLDKEHVDLNETQKQLLGI